MHKRLYPRHTCGSTLRPRPPSAERASAEDLLVTVTTLPERNHYTIMEELASPDGMLTSALVELITGVTPSA